MGRTACTEPQCLYKGDLYLLSKFTIENGALCYRVYFSSFCNNMYEGIGQFLRLDTLFKELTSLFPVLNCWFMVTRQRKPHCV
jgi:hypothetical protein